LDNKDMSVPLKHQLSILTETQPSEALPESPHKDHKASHPQEICKVSTNLPRLHTPEMDKVKSIKVITHVSDRMAITKGAIKKQPVPVLLDIGANCNLIDQNIVERLNLPKLTLEEPIEAEFANGTTYLMTEYTKLELKMGNYLATISFILCPIGPILILGTPWYEEVKTTIDLYKQCFTFYERAWPSSTVFAPTKYTLKLLSKKDFTKWMVELGTMPANHLKSVKQRAPTKTPRFIGLMTTNELERIKKNARIYSIELQEILEESPSEPSKLSPDATARDVRVRVRVRA